MKKDTLHSWVEIQLKKVVFLHGYPWTERCIIKACCDTADHIFAHLINDKRFFSPQTIDNLRAQYDDCLTHDQAFLQMRHCVVIIMLPNHCSAEFQQSVDKTVAEITKTKDFDAPSIIIIRLNLLTPPCPPEPRWKHKFSTN